MTGTFGERPSMVLIGTGGLARGLAYALGALARTPLRLVVAGRNAERAAEVCYVTATRAALTGAPVEVQPVTVDPTGDLAAELAALNPAGVVLAASTQSPWEATRAPSAWTSLVRSAGFGLTLPFQADFAVRTGRAIAEACPGAWFVNACFPDAVNPVLSALGVPVLCGIGNVNLLAASLRGALGLGADEDLAVLAHHAHLHDQPEEARAWVRGEPVTGVGGLLAAQRTTTRSELNHVTGLAAARVLLGLLDGAEQRASLPGPLGLPGGYPVRLKGDRLELALPAGLSRDEAVAFNQRSAILDGVIVENGTISFTPGLTAFPNFPVHELDRVRLELDQLRTRLRDRHPSEHPHA
ncbi:hypothetical protein OIE66_11095 [Nonomuraea sp. NBC_01738]|uniref:hypothetical protein n=1 Tax=Nonomuraea sp. NBC_01738 TaxID=2976003 RepID=UPI002E15D5B3|nr:hypothetical protein OIE66_11095 [Nonomuraea sp. NBC_01738]